MPDVQDESAGRPGRAASGRLPTLTEIIDVGAEAQAAADGEAACGEAEAPATVPEAAGVPPGAAAAIDEMQVVRRVLADLERQVDLLLEYRLREVLGPALARASDMLIRETRNELAATLRDIVARAVAHELTRQRDPSD